MPGLEVERFVTRVFMYWLPLATVFILSAYITDPINVTKFVSVGLVAFGLLGVLVLYGAKAGVFKDRVLLVAAGLFVGSLLVSSVFSSSAFSQSLYGTYGRNTGLLSYLIFCVLAFAALFLRSRDSFQKLLFGLMLAGGANFIYGGWALFFGDPFKLNNVYGSIFGFLGNPDFLSAFLGMFVTAILSLIVAKDVDWRPRVGGGVVSLAAIYEIYRSHAQQGFLVVAIGFAFVGLNLLRAQAKLRVLTIPYVAVVALGGVAVLFGSLDHGPLSFLHKASVVFRGWYWHAAISMGTAHPLTGVGLDNYGNWYRRSRSLAAVIAPTGPNKVSDAAHNVVLDMFASGGWLLLVTYLLVMAVALRANLRILRRSTSYDPIFVAIAGVWITYQWQSLISINQIGLAAWGWVFTGALVAYEVATRKGFASEVKKGSIKQVKRKAEARDFLTPQVAFYVGAIVGLIILLPPFLSDSSFSSALRSGDAAKIEAAMKTGYFAPPTSYKYSATVSIFDSNKLFDKARVVNLQGLKFNPDSFDMWKALYLRSNTTAAEKDEALANMKRLDPLNPDVTAMP
jgi:O-antigen ligase